jgi:hypothetical protein
MKIHTRIPSQVIKLNPGASKVWGLVRALDEKGSGWAEFSITEACELFAKVRQGNLKPLTPATIRRYVMAGKRLGFFRDYKQTGDRILVYYSSIRSIWQRHGLRELGAIASIEVERLAQPTILATEIQAEYSQRRSIHVARETEKEAAKREARNPREIADLEKLLESCGNLGAGKFKNFKSTRFALVSSDFLLFGTSQVTVAEGRGTSVRTTQRHLNNRYREQRLVESLEKKQILSIVSPSIKEALSLGRNCKDSGVRKEVARYKIILGCVFYSHCNLYALDLDLPPSRYLRKRLNRLDRRQK